MSESLTLPQYPGLRITADGRLRGPSGKWLKPFPGKSGYLRFNLYNAASRTWKQLPVHVVVCEAFHGPRPLDSVVRHLNGNHRDNRAENLAWGSQVENEEDKRTHGRNLAGERHHQAKLTDSDVYAIRSDLQSGVRGSRLAAHYGVSQGTIGAIRLRKTWRHL